MKYIVQKFEEKQQQFSLLTKHSNTTSLLAKHLACDVLTMENIERICYVLKYWSLIIVNVINIQKLNNRYARSYPGNLTLNAPTFNYEYRLATSTYFHHTSTCMFLNVRF